MDFLDKYKYHKDDPSEFGIDLKEFKKNSIELDNSHLSNLLTNSVRVSKNITSLKRSMLVYIPRTFGTVTMKTVCQMAWIARGDIPRNKPAIPCSSLICFQ